MGPGLALPDIRRGRGTYPVALIFCFENILHFAIAPLMMALSGEERASPLAGGSQGWSARSPSNPFIIGDGGRAVLGRLAPVSSHPSAVDRLLQYRGPGSRALRLVCDGASRWQLRPLYPAQARAARNSGLIAALKLVIPPASSATSC